MVQSNSNEEFCDLVEAAELVLKSQTTRDGQLEGDFALFVSRKQFYATYCLRLLPGNRNRKGSTIAEVNHLSVLSYLNGDRTGINGYREHPMLLIRDLLKRQEKHVILTNMELFKMEQHMKIERAKLELEPDIDVIKDLRKAAKKLNHVAYKRYKLSQSRISEYSVTRKVDLLTTNPIVTVQSTRHPDAPPRTFLDLPGHRCNCEERCSELDMCVHEILGKGGFNVSLFEERHLTRTEVQGSLAGWKMPPENTLDEIIGLSKEVMDQRTEITEMEVSNVENSIKLFQNLNQKRKYRLVICQNKVTIPNRSQKNRWIAYGVMSWQDILVIRTNGNIRCLC